MWPAIARIGSLLAKGGRYARAAARAFKVSRVGVLMRTHGKRLLKWAVAPLTKYGSKLSTRLSARFILAGRSLAALAVKYPKLAKPLNAIARALTNHGNAKFLANLFVSATGAAGLEVALRAITGDPRGEEAQKIARELGLDLSDDDDAATFDSLLSSMADSADYLRFVYGRSVVIDDLAMESPSFAAQREEFERAVGAYVLHGDQAKMKEFLSGLTPVGFLQIAGRLASLAIYSTGWHGNDKAQKIARIRLFLISQTGVALHDGVNRVCEALLRSTDEVANDALDLVEGAILANAQGVADMLVDTIDDEFNSAWDNVKGFFTSDSTEAEKIYAEFSEPDKKLLAYAMSVLCTVISAGSTAVGDLLSSDDEELHFAAEAINRIALDVDASGDNDDDELSAKSRLFARACLEGSGSKLHDALYDE